VGEVLYSLYLIERMIWNWEIDRSWKQVYSFRLYSCRCNVMNIVTFARYYLFSL